MFGYCKGSDLLGKKKWYLKFFDWNVFFFMFLSIEMLSFYYEDSDNIVIIDIESDNIFKFCRLLVF